MCLTVYVGHNIQLNKVKVIVTLFSCSNDFAIYFEADFMDYCLIDSITKVGHLDLYFMVQ